jgi:transposase
MTTKTRRAFTDEFKREAVSLLAGSGRPVTQVATELGVQPSMLRAWRGNGTTAAGPMSLAVGPGGATAAPSAEQAEIRRLQKELDRAQMERDILKKAIAIFSGPPR